LAASKQLHLSGPATADLEQISDYTLRTWGAAQNRIYLDHIKDAFKALRDTPGMGAPCDATAKGLRAHPVRHHLVFYRETTAAVVIVRVLHASMDPDHHL